MDHRVRISHLNTNILNYKMDKKAHLVYKCVVIIIIFFGKVAEGAVVGNKIRQESKNLTTTMINSINNI